MNMPPQYAHLPENDIPQVVKLFQKVFFNNGQTAPSSSNLGAYFEETFFRKSWTIKRLLQRDCISSKKRTERGLKRGPKRGPKRGLKRGLKKRYGH